MYNVTTVTTLQHTQNSPICGIEMVSQYRPVP